MRSRGETVEGEMTRKRDDTRRGKRWGETSGRRTDENEKEG